jgi:hypothetical protein
MTIEIMSESVKVPNPSCGFWTSSKGAVKVTWLSPLLKRSWYRVFIDYNLNFRSRPGGLIVMRNLLSRQGTRNTPRGSLIFMRGKYPALGRLSWETSIPGLNKSKGIPSVEDDRTWFRQSLAALNNNSNLSKSMSSLACRTEVVRKKVKRS